MPSPTPRLALAALVVAVVPLLAGCTTLASGLDINIEAGVEYPSHDVVMQSEDRFRVPRLVPDDAEQIRIAFATVESGGIFAFTSDGGITADYCAPAELTDTPLFEPDWLPDPTPRDGLACGAWSVVHVDDVYYAWD